ncbi:MAG: hypothetical protein K2Y40_01035 [Reyranella sp.]|nr:hypothetical protein [Reyranella sp.]
MSPDRRGWIAEVFGRVALVAASTIVALLVLELGCRAWRHPSLLVDWLSAVVLNDIPANPSVGSTIYDPILGFVPKPGFAAPPYTHDPQGFRTMPPLPDDAAHTPPVLATGDSFAYGAEVPDDRTWPAYLQGLIHRRTINAGVLGYGLDQIVMRTERLVPAVQPAVTVVSFIADDVRRIEMSRLWGHEKPYFDLNGPALALRNVPVPPDPAPGSTQPLWLRAFGWSALLDVVVSRLAYDRHEWRGESARALPRGMGERLACPLMARLAKLDAPILVVAQYDLGVWGKDRWYGIEERRLSRLVLQCAAEARLATLDLFEVLDQTVRTHGLGALYGDRSTHHNAAGNRLVAESIAAELGRRRLLP